jgi:cell division protein ZapD
MLIIGLTGGIGSGKTTVARRFEALGVPVIDADIIAHQLVEPGKPAYESIINTFGPAIADSNGKINRTELRELVFNDDTKRTQLEGILHPLVRERMQMHVQELDAPYCILMIPLLIETGQMDIVDRVLVVDSEKSQQIQRATARDGVTEDNVNAIIAAQIDRDTRLSLADDVIENNSSLESLYAKVDALHDRYMSMLNPKPNSMNSPATTSPLKTVNSPASQQMENKQIPGQISVAAMPWLEENINDQIMADNAAENIVYELPLNERLRTLMRLEGLFEEIYHHLDGSNVWDTRSAIRGLINLLNALNRPDIKTELIKEMDRLNLSLGKFKSVPGVDTERLERTQNDLSRISKALRGLTAHIGHQLRQNELIASIKQREIIPGGPSTFDLPCYGYWLNQNIEYRHQCIREWLQEFDLLREAVELVLQIVRESALPSDEVAESGTFQLILDSSVTYQLIRVVLPRSAKVCAEISGGRHRFGVRFVEPGNPEERPLQSKQDVKFLLACCAI